MTDPVEAEEPAEPVDPADELGPDEAGTEPDHEPGPPEPRRYPSTIGGACYLVILLVALGAVAIVMAGDWRVGVRVLGGCLATAGALRLVLPQRDAGMLAVRHRLVDVAIFLAVAGLLWWLAGSIPDQPS
ncbi:DUF3017 domain-containing protein [Nocardioides sp.]|uniref:DUF3017 domain-containing protein n=1 Tax=Nocardioides sp. TaxID=35761 RepID=UPI00271F24A3|nr:DUF3017 domain-containing protein [Nocardioides sp.]MDO9457717.1 DUF3017 domain-containing protein [Nocardioides sp.]